MSRRWLWAFNTKQVPANEAPRSHADLLHPKWKGRMNLGTEEYTWFNIMLDSMGKAKGNEYMQALAKQDLAMPGSSSVMRVQLMVAGESAIANAARARRVSEYKQQGAPASDAAAPGVPSSLNVLAGRTQFEAAPGRLDLRLSVRDADGRSLDNDVTDVTVPDFTSPQTRLSTLEVVRARSARELQALKSDIRAQPTATREFRRTERLLIRFEVYGPRGTTPGATAKLLNRDGQPMMDLPLEPPAGEARYFQGEVPISSLAPGEYLIEIAGSGLGGSTRQLVGIKITS